VLVPPFVWIKQKISLPLNGTQVKDMEIAVRELMKHKKSGKE
jgi:hypothetical protein